MLLTQLFISEISGPEVMFALTIIMAIVLYKRRYIRDFYIVLATSTLAMATTYLLKYLLRVPRPDAMLATVHDYRFPSGHATMAAVIMSLGIYYTHTHVHDKHLRYFFYIAAVGWYILISYSRLYLGVHLPVDVIVGGVIGVVSAIGIVKFKK